MAGACSPSPRQDSRLGGKAQEVQLDELLDCRRNALIFSEHEPGAAAVDPSAAGSHAKARFTLRYRVHRAWLTPLTRLRCALAGAIGFAIAGYLRGCAVAG